MDVPRFLKLEGESLLFNEDGKEFAFVISEQFFNNTSKNPIAEIQGRYVSTIGLCEWVIGDKEITTTSSGSDKVLVDGNKKKLELKPFSFPTMFLCRPSRIEKVKNLKTNTNSEPSEYRLLIFKKGDEVISQTRVPQMIDNVELFYKIAVVTAKIPTSIPYDEGWKLFSESMELNGSKFGLNEQLFGILWSAICRDPSDLSKPFRYSSMSNMNNYKPISVKLVPKFTGIFQSIVSEGWDDSLAAAILMKDKQDLPYSPIEKVVTQ